MHHSSSTPADPIFDGPGDMRALCRALDWSQTELGALSLWPQSLRTAAQLVLAAPFSNILLWGEKLIQIYNDGYQELMGNKHPAGLGQPTQQCWPEVWHINQPIYQRVWAGESLSFEDALYPITRSGQLQDAWFTLAYSPVLAESGQVGGILVTVFETTTRLRNEQHREQALFNSEEKYRTLFNSIDEGFCLIELLDNQDGKAIDYRFLEVNAVFERQTGYVDAKGKRATELAPGLTQAWIDTVDAVARTGESLRTEAFFADPARWFAISMARLGEAPSRRVASVFNDITDRKQAEQHQTFLLHLTDVLRPMQDVQQIATTAMHEMAQMLDVLRAGYYEVEADQDTFSLTASWERTGATPLPPKMIFTEFGTEVREGYRAGRTLVVRDTEVDMAEEENRAAHRAINVRAWIGVPLIKHGRMVVGLGVHSQTPRDWTPAEIRLVEEVAERTRIAVERARAEEALRQSEAKYRNLFETMSEGFGICELIRDQTGQAIDWRFLELNPALEGHTGMDRQASIGSLFSELFPGVDRQYWLAVYQQVVDTQSARKFEDYWPPINRWLAGTATPAGGEYFTIVYEDVTQRRQVQQALQEANQRKDEFLAMLAHELRNPMATIRSGLQILTVTDGKDETSRSTIAMMNRQTDHLVRMVDDLLDVSRISQGKIELKKQRLNLVEVVTQAAESIQPLYQQQGRHLLLELSSASIYVDGDSARLTQVVVNLLTNGVRYTGENGSVWLRLSQQAGPRQSGSEVLIEVRDNGIGLAADQRSAIFELFVQVDNSVARSKGGLGIGLTLVKRLTELHGGRVEVQSEGVGKGSTFQVYLPLLDTAPEAPEAPAGEQTIQASTLRILVVDDNADAALTLSMLLKLKGYDVHTRHTGQEAVQAAESLRPSVIVCDIGMPGMDGYEAARQIRQQPGGATVLLIALTGYGQAEDKQRTKAAGFDGHLVKPVDLEALIGLIAENKPKPVNLDSLLSSATTGSLSVNGQLQSDFDQPQIASRQRSEALRQLTHDLRSSLGVVVNTVSFLEMPVDKAERSQLLEMLSRNLVSARELLDQLSHLAHL